MTKRVSDLKLLAEDIPAARSWLIFMILAGALLLLPFALQMELSALEYGNPVQAAEDLKWLRQTQMDIAERILGGGNFLVLLGCMFAAVAAGRDGIFLSAVQKAGGFLSQSPGSPGTAAFQPLPGRAA